MDHAPVVGLEQSPGVLQRHLLHPLRKVGGNAIEDLVQDAHCSTPLCGLAGERRFSGRADVGVVDRMADVLAPRGPDGAGGVAEAEIRVQSSSHGRPPVASLAR